MANFLFFQMRNKILFSYTQKKLENNLKNSKHLHDFQDILRSFRTRRQFTKNVFNYFLRNSKK